MKTGGKSCASCGERYGPEVLFCPVDGVPLSSGRSLANSAAELDPYLGLALEGQIRLDALVGIGSMGRVYRAHQRGVDRDVAVKILHRELTGNTELVSRFHREAKIASRLVHPNVVQVLMTGALPQGSDARAGGEVYLVMEFLDGISLLSALAAQGEGGALPLARALHIVLQLCDAVGEAHAQGVVHRDIKPENIMLVRRGEDPDFVKVLDFGIARLDWADEQSNTQAGLIFGTAKYISPEGAEGKPVDPRADVYGIATILYQCLAGRAPFEGDTPMALLVQQIHAPPADLKSIARASYVPDAIARVVMQNLAKSPAERAENARELGRDLSIAAREAGIALDGLRSARKGELGLASKQRTKQHEFSDELRAKIKSIPTPGAAAATSDPDPAAAAPLPSTPPEDPTLSGEGPFVDTADPTASGTPSGRPSADVTEAGADAPGDPDSASGPAGATELVDEGDTIPGALDAALRPRPSSPGPTIPGAPIVDRPSRAHARQAVTHAPSPSDGVVELDPPPDSRPARGPWSTVLLVAALLAVPALAMGGVVLYQRAHAVDDSVATQLELAEDAMDRRAWDAPAGQNVRELTDRALQLSPGDRRVLALRRTAAERIVTEALGRKYAGAHANALELARLALTLSPDLTTAQHLVVELEGPRADASSDATPSVAPTASVAGALVPHGRGPRPTPTASFARGAPSGPGHAAPSESSPDGPALPPPQPPDLVPPAAGSARPWL